MSAPLRSPLSGDELFREGFGSVLSGAYLLFAKGKRETPSGAIGSARTGPLATEKSKFGARTRSPTRGPAVTARCHAPPARPRSPRRTGSRGCTPHRGRAALAPWSPCHLRRSSERRRAPAGVRPRRDDPPCPGTPPTRGPRWRVDVPCHGVQASPECPIGWPIRRSATAPPIAGRRFPDTTERLNHRHRDPCVNGRDKPAGPLDQQSECSDPPDFVRPVEHLPRNRRLRPQATTARSPVKDHAW